jgi:hypothetical protein
VAAVPTTAEPPDAARAASAPRPLRLLEVADPFLTGPDVLALQQAANRHLQAHARAPIDEDGAYGPITDRATRIAGWWLGAAESTLAPAQLAVGVQRLVLELVAPTAAQRRRASGRIGLPVPPSFGPPPDHVPRIVTAHMMGLVFSDVFGELGPERFVTGHYTAGPRAVNADQGVAIVRAIHREHAARGWGGAGYHYVIADDGTLLGVRPTRLNGAHTAGHNASNIGICCPGGTGDRPTARQRAAYRWLLANAHTGHLPTPHRTDLDLREAIARGHRQWPDNPTACPGLFLDMYLRP